LTSISSVVGDECLQVVSEFFGPKIMSSQWTDRYAGMIAFAAILNRPTTD